MKNTLPYAEKLMSLLSGSPEVKVLIEREKRQVEDAEKQARIDCLARIKTLQLAELEAKQKLDAALALIEDAQTKVVTLKAKVGGVIHAHNEAQAKLSHTRTELMKVHGEGVVLNTLYRIEQLIKATKAKINDLELAQKPSNRDLDGNLRFQPISPNIKLNQKVLKQRLEVFEKLYAKTKEFVNAEMAPSEIKELCELICKTIGQPRQSPDTQS